MMISKRCLSPVLLFAWVLASVIGCTRPDSENSKISVSVPSQMSSTSPGAQATTEKLGHVVINVSGPGIAEPILLTWDGHDNSTSPDSFQIDIPKGDARLIQLLAVYMNSTGAMSMYYGDATKSLKNADELVSIAVSAIGSGTAIEGHISGRYLTSANSGPTGEVKMKFFPPNKPALLVMRDGIYNGWFNFFMFDGDSTSKFGYELGDGTLLWGRPVSLMDSEFQPSSQIVRVAMPLSYSKRTDNSVTTWNLTSAGTRAFGYFGPAAASAVVCRPDTMTGDLASLASLSGRTVGVPIPPAVNSTPAALPGALLVSSALPTASQLMDSTSFYPGYRVKGGYESTNAACSGGTEAVTKMTLANLYTIILNGDDTKVGYHFGLFKAQVTSDSSHLAPALVSKNGSDFQISGELNTGLRGVYFDRLKFFKRVSTDSWELHEDPPPCHEIERGLFGFVPSGEAVLAADVFSGISVGLLPADTQAPNSAMVAVCAANGAQVFDVGFILNKWQFNSGGGGGGGGGGPTLGLKLTGSDLNNSGIDWVPPLDSTARNFSVSNLTNNFHLFFPYISNSGVNYITSPGDLASLEIRIFDGTTWSSFGAGITPMTSLSTYTGGPNNRVGFQISAANVSGATKFQVRFSISAALQTTAGLTTSTYTSPEYSLIAGCTGGANLKIRRTLPTVTDYTSANFLNDMVDTDFEGTYRLVDTTNPTCETADLLIDYISQTGGGACWDNNNIFKMPSDPFQFRISPGDRTGVSCSVSSLTASVITPSNAASEKVMRTSFSGTVTHSSTLAKIGAFLTEDGSLSGTPINLRLKLGFFLAGPSQVVDLKILRLNSDEQVVDLATAAGYASLADYTVPANPSTFFAGGYPSASNRFNLTTTAAPTATTVSVIAGHEGVNPGGFYGLVGNLSGSIQALSNESLAGGSKLMAVFNGSGYDIKHISSNSGNFDGKTMDVLLSTPAASAVQIFNSKKNIPNGNGFYVMTNNDFYQCAYSYMTRTAVCDSTLESSYIGGTVTFKDMRVMADGSGNEVIYLVWDTAGTLYNQYIYPKNFNGTTFTGSYAMSSSTGTINLTGMVYIGIVGGRQNPNGGIIPAYIVARKTVNNNLNYVVLPPTNWAGGSLTLTDAGYAMSASHDAAEVAVDTMNNIDYRLAIMTYSKTIGLGSSYPVIFLINPSSNACGTPNSVSTITTTVGDYVSGVNIGAPLQAVVAGGYPAGGEGFYLSTPRPSTKTGFEYWKFWCNGSVLTIDRAASGVNLGGLPHAGILGMGVGKFWRGMAGVPLLEIFGANHVMYSAEIH